MEFRDRVPQHPGRVKLSPVSGQTNVYDMTWADGATANGTPLNASTFEQFRQDLIDYIADNPGPQGAKGDKGDPGVAVSCKSFLVGTDSLSGAGWYKLGSVTLGSSIDYHAKMLITRTYRSSEPMPSGLIGISVRRASSSWDADIRWETFEGGNPDYIAYYLNTSGVLWFYAYIPKQYEHYRVDILCESNRNDFTKLFEPVVEYGEVNHTRHSTSKPAITGYPQQFSNEGAITVYYKNKSGDGTCTSQNFTESVSANYSFFRVGKFIFNFITVEIEAAADAWMKITMPNAISVQCLPKKPSTAFYSPGMIGYISGDNVYVGLDENSFVGTYIMIVQKGE